MLLSTLPVDQRYATPKGAVKVVVSPLHNKVSVAKIFCGCGGGFMLIVCGLAVTTQPKLVVALRLAV
jgi:hypothetical protein